MRLFAEFAYLQVLDILTTVAFLLMGVGEANPFVRWAIGHSSNPLTGLVLVKIAALSLAGFCIWRSRLKLLRRVNLFFAGLVAYNMIAIILASQALQG